MTESRLEHLTVVAQGIERKKQSPRSSRKGVQVGASLFLELLGEVRRLRTIVEAAERFLGADTDGDAPGAGLAKDELRSLIVAWVQAQEAADRDIAIKREARHTREKGRQDARLVKDTAGKGARPAPTR